MISANQVLIVCYVNGRYKIVFSAAWTKQFSYGFIVKLWWLWYLDCMDGVELVLPIITMIVLY